MLKQLLEKLAPECLKPDIEKWKIEREFKSIVYQRMNEIYSKKRRKK